MLRIAFALLIVANLGYYLWNQGHLAAIGLMPVAQTEPQRLEQQIKPEALKILADQASSLPAPQEAALAPATPAATPAEPAPAQVPAQAAAQMVSATPEPVPAPTPSPAPATTPVSGVKEATRCMQTDGLDERQAAGIRRALASTPQEQWELNSSTQNARWMVYMGKLPDAELLERKRSELRGFKVDFDRAGGSFEPGLSLGRFSSEEAANRHLSTLSNKGVRTARVVQERPEVTTYSLRLPKATASFKSALESQAAKYLDGKALRSCPN